MFEYPKGNTPQANKANVKAIIGAKKYTNKLTWLGITVSFVNNFTPSAKGWSKP